MKVAVDAGPLYGHRTGVGVATAGMIRALDARDDVELLPYLTSRRSTPEPGHRRLPVPGIVASHLWSRFDRPSADRWVRGADVLHGTNYVAPPTSVPTVVSVYDCWFLRHPELASPLVRRAGLALRRAIARGAWVHATSDTTADDVRSLLGTDRVRTVRLGPPDPVEPPPVPPAAVSSLAGATFVLAVGTEERRKDLPLLLEAFAILAREHPDVVLVLAGAPGDDSDRVAATMPTSATVHRLGRVDDATKAWLIRHAAVLAYPSLDEGFGFPILEAQASGTPVVATAVGSIPEIAGSAAVLVDDPARRPGTLADALASVLTGAGRLSLIADGYQNVRRFDWGVTADRLVDLYRTAMADT